MGRLMSLPPGVRYSDVFEAAFQRELDARGVLLDEPDQERAAKLVAEAEAEAWREVRGVAVSTLLTEARRRLRDAEREQRRHEADAKRHDQEASEASKAWRKLYGRSIAKQLEPWTAYTVLDAAAGRFIFAARDEFEPRLRAALGGGEVIGMSTGVGIGKITAQLDLVVADEAAIDKAVVMVRAAEQERREADAAERRAHAVTLARKREEARQLSA
jgi:hypothetical protein